MRGGSARPRPPEVGRDDVETCQPQPEGLRSGGRLGNELGGRGRGDRLVVLRAVLAGRGLDRHRHALGHALRLAVDYHAHAKNIVVRSYLYNQSSIW